MKFKQLSHVLLCCPLNTKVNISEEPQRRIMNKSETKPAWLDLLLRRNFFQNCHEHQFSKNKCETNTYCIDCDLTMCPRCLLSPSMAHHKQGSHRMLQIRRYVYQDVVRIDDINKLLDCSKIQTYVVNSSKVVHLNPKKNCKTVTGKEGHACEICHKPITESFKYCSIACKVSEESGELLQSSDCDDQDGSNSCSAPSCHDASPSENSSLSKSRVLAAKGRISKRKGIPRRSFLF